MLVKNALPVFPRPLRALRHMGGRHLKPEIPRASDIRKSYYI